MVTQLDVGHVIGRRAGLPGDAHHVGHAGEDAWVHPGEVTTPGQRAKLSTAITPGMRAVSISVNDVLGVAGFVLPGDRVDVMLAQTIEVQEGSAYPDKQIRMVIPFAAGGTTDLIINSYRLEGAGTSVTLFPEQKFREGFNVAGDDILLRVVQGHVLPPIETALRNAGIANPADLMAELVGGDRGGEEEEPEGGSGEERVRRRRLCWRLQVAGT